MDFNQSDTVNIYIKNSKPVSLDVLSYSLQGYAELYNSFIEKSGFNKDFESKLYIQEIKKGSIVLDLAIGGGVSLLADATNIHISVEFVKFLQSVYSFFSGKIDKSQLPFSISNKECDAVHKATEINAQDVHSNTTYSAHDSKGNVYQNCTFNLNGLEANAMQNIVENYTKHELQEQKSTYKSNVAMYWDKAKNPKTDHIKSTDIHGKAIIEDFDVRPKSINFINDIDRQKCMSKDNFMDFIYMVDVETIYINNRLKIYNIHKVHDSTFLLNDND
jgi:hypothetical protein